MASAAGSPVEGEGQVGRVRPRLGDLRSHITCVLCAGYFIDATTIVECLHTFCRSCILRHLEASAYCPICEVKIHRTKGSSSLRADRILQTLVYKIVPGLFRQEMEQRRDFYQQKPYADPELPGWAKGDVTSYVPHVFTADQHVHVRLALFDADRSFDDSMEQPDTGPSADIPPVRYLRCQAGTPITVLQKFVRTKFQIPPAVQVQLISGQHVLPDDVTLMDLGYMADLTQDGPMRLSFRLVQRRKRPAAEKVLYETPVIKSARLDTPAPVIPAARPSGSDTPPPETPAASSSRSDTLPPETTAAESACLDAPLHGAPAARSACLVPPPLEISAARSACLDVPETPASKSGRSGTHPPETSAVKSMFLNALPIETSAARSTRLDTFPPETPAVKMAQPDTIPAAKSTHLETPPPETPATKSACMHSLPAAKSVHRETPPPETFIDKPASLDTPPAAKLAYLGTPPPEIPVKSASLDPPPATKFARLGTPPPEIIVKSASLDTPPAAKSAHLETPPLKTPTVRSACLDTQGSAKSVQLETSLSEVPVVNSPSLDAPPAAKSAHVETPLPEAPCVKSVCLNALAAVVVDTERMFDVDDEEPTSPQVVEDIIASLDAEEEEPARGGAAADVSDAADEPVGDGVGTVGSSYSVSDVICLKGDVEAPAVGATGKEGALVDIDVELVNGKGSIMTCEMSPGKYKVRSGGSETAEVTNTRDCASDKASREKRGKGSDGNGTNVDSSRAAAVIVTPRAVPAAAANLETRGTSSDAGGTITVNKTGGNSIESAVLVESSIQFHESAKDGCEVDDVSVDQSRAGSNRAGAAVIYGTMVVKKNDGVSADHCDDLKANEVTIEKQRNLSAQLPVPHSRDNGQSTEALNLPKARKPDCSVHTLSVSKAAKYVSNIKKVPCYAQSRSTKAKAKTTAEVEESLLGSSASSSVTSTVKSTHASEKAKHASKEASRLPDPYELNVPTPSRTSLPTCRTMLKIPKMFRSGLLAKMPTAHQVNTTDNITKPQIIPSPKLKSAPTSDYTKLNGHSTTAHNAGFDQNAARKRYLQEPIGQPKSTKFRQDGCTPTVPLDLSNPSKKTVAADSTSMLPKPPMPLPKPKLQRMKTGKPQNIHSLVNSLANREHISLTAIPARTPALSKKSSHYSKLTEVSSTLSSHQSSSTEASRKHAKTTAALRKPHHQPKSPAVVSAPMSPHRPLPMSLPTPESASCFLPPGGLCSPPLHVDTSVASRLGYDMAMRNLLTLSHMAMAQGGMVRPHMFPMQPMFPPRPNSHDYARMPDPSLLRQQSEVRMGAASKKASPTAGTTAPQLRTPTALTSASIQHMEDLTRTVGKRADKQRHSVTVTAIPFEG